MILSTFCIHYYFIDRLQQNIKTTESKKSESEHLRPDIIMFSVFLDCLRAF